MSWQQDFANSHVDNTLPYPERVPLAILEKIKDGSQVFKDQFIYSHNELAGTGNLDPIGDLKNAKGNGIIHRYENRILFTPTTVCPINCRYCFRKNELSAQNEIFKPKLEQLNQYLKQHQKIEEVILTGGDPLILSTSKLSKILDVCAENKIKYLRFHTRTPVVIPSRIDQEFLNFLNTYAAKFKMIFFVIHTNHREELSSEVLAALDKISSERITKLSQSVLLRGINDNPQALRDLFIKLSEHSIRPYYLHHPDQVKGAMHFYLSPAVGKKIYGKLRSLVPGWAVPHYILDSPEGTGKKLTVNPDY